LLRNWRTAANKDCTEERHRLLSSTPFQDLGNVGQEVLALMADHAYQSAADWSARQYLKFEDERTRPPRDLLAQVPLQSPRRVVDLGCGPGNSTEMLIERFPDAEVIGIDSSPDMLRQARERLPRRTFVEGDLTTWKPEPDTDLLFGNAVFQWVPDHPKVLGRLLKLLPQGGVLRRRPDIRAAERELAAATARIGVATADLFPSVSLTAGYGAQHASQHSTTPIPLHGPIWSFGPAVYWPLLDFGRLDALINIEDMQAQDALVKYRKTIIAAVEEVDQAITRYRLDL
jgi:SAM-dependent methyltransferase